MSEEQLLEYMEKIYYIWDYVSKEKAKNMLKKLYFQELYKFKKIESKRLVSHNLTTIIMQILKDKEISDLTPAKLYAKATKEMLDDYPNYKNTQLNKERYCRALNNYTECFKNELTKEELIEIYQFCYDTYKDYTFNNKEEYMEKLIAQFNLNLIKLNFSIVLLVVEDIIIHNDTTDYESTLKSFMIDIKNTDETIYNQASLLLQRNIQEII